MPAEAQDAYVLSPADVRNIRSYVQMKYAAMPQEKKAEIVADAVARIIHRQLPSFEEATKKRITAELIRNVVLEQQRPVRSEHILQVCLKLDWKSSPIMAPFQEWVLSKVQLAADKPCFVAAVEQMHKQEMREEEQTFQQCWPELKLLLEQEGAVPLAADEEAVKLPAQANVIPLPGLSLVPPLAEETGSPSKLRPYLYGFICLLLIAASLFYGWSLTLPSHEKLQPPVTLDKFKQADAQDGLPQELRYTDVDKQRLADYLAKRSSLLAQEPYLSAIIAVSKQFDIHPLLLFAITGQEQGFVPATHKQAEQIANNPFNVFHSWKEYNTNITDSAEIASRTIVRLSKGRPEGVDPFAWINREYAEDPNWSKGVRTIFAALKQEVETPH
ncbi:glucosaminidase domain-containing protein [Paenibacillus protaetiae]|nr:glucosaminidase domain-containing protein [Paenibacillus protaetiae]